MSDYKQIYLSYTDYDTILKDLFTFDINLSIKDKIEVSDQHLIDDLKSYPEELDLNKPFKDLAESLQRKLISKQIRNFYFGFIAGFEQNFMC